MTEGADGSRDPSAQHTEYVAEWSLSPLVLTCESAIEEALTHIERTPWHEDDERVHAILRAAHAAIDKAEREANQPAHFSVKFVQADQRPDSPRPMVDVPVSVLDLVSAATAFRESRNPVDKRDAINRMNAALDALPTLMARPEPATVGPRCIPGVACHIQCTGCGAPVGRTCEEHKAMQDSETALTPEQKQKECCDAIAMASDAQWNAAIEQAAKVAEQTQPVMVALKQMAVPVPVYEPNPYAATCAANIRKLAVRTGSEGA